MLETPAAAASGATSADPVVIDLGKVKKKAVKALKQGRGPLIEEIDDVISQVRESLAEAGVGQTILPVIVLYREKPKKKTLASLLKL
jgi:cellobiose-specific phosphotransferase system component IIA